MSETGSEYRVHHKEGATYEEGLRDYFVYRDLELGKATGGKFHAQIVKARRALEGGTGRHKHDVNFHFVYVVKGWVSFDFKDVGHVVLKEGDSQYMPEGIHHELMACSEDCEMLEIHSPGTIGSHDIPEFERLDKQV